MERTSPVPRASLVRSLTVGRPPDVLDLTRVSRHRPVVAVRSGVAPGRPVIGLADPRPVGVRRSAEGASSPLRRYLDDLAAGRG